MSARNGRSKYAPVPGTIPGIDVTLSGVTLTLAPININQVKALAPVIKQLNEIAASASLEQQMEAAVPIVFAAAVRNHPDISEDDVRELVDVGNFKAALEAAMAVGGFEKRAGEAKAARSTGTTSSPPSSSLPAGLGNTAAST